MKNLMLIGVFILTTSVFAGNEVSARFGLDKGTGVPQPKAESVLEAHSVYEALDIKTGTKGAKTVKSLAGEFKCSRPVRGIVKYEGDCLITVSKRAVVSSSLDSVVIVGDMAAKLYLAINKNRIISDQNLGHTLKKVANVKCMKISGITVSYKCKLSDLVVK